MSETAPTQAQGPRALQGAMNVPIEQIAADPDQPRRAMDDEGLRDLAASMTEYGVLQPLLVREDGYLDDERARYKIVAGGRRYAAALLAGITRLPVVVRDTEGVALRITQLVENVQRQDLAPLDEARAFKELMDAEGLDSVALGKRLHISGQHVRDLLLLLTDEVVADAVQRQQVAPTVAREVLRLPDKSRAPLRARIDAGERVGHADVQEVKARDAATGVVNPRSTGGGRRACPSPPQPSPPLPVQPSSEVQEEPGQQTMFAGQTVNAPTATAPQEDTADDLQEALNGIPVTHLAVVFQYGIARQWTCAQLWQTILEHQSAAQS